MGRDFDNSDVFVGARACFHVCIVIATWKVARAFFFVASAFHGSDFLEPGKTIIIQQQVPVPQTSNTGVRRPDGRPARTEQPNVSVDVAASLRDADPSRPTRTEQPNVSVDPAESRQEAAVDGVRYTEVRFEATPNFRAILQQLGVSLMASTYQAGKLVAIGAGAAEPDPV